MPHVRKTRMIVARDVHVFVSKAGMVFLITKYSHGLAKYLGTSGKCRDSRLS